MTVETKDEKEEENNEEIVLDELMKVCNSSINDLNILNSSGENPVEIKLSFLVNNLTDLKEI